VIATDALSSWLSEEGLKRICGLNDSSSISKINHQLSRNRYVIYRYKTKLDLIETIIEKAILGERCYIACTWKSDTESISRILANRGIKVRSYTSETDPSQREELRNVEQYWAQYQVIVTSPAVDTGVSYDKDPRFGFVALVADRTGPKAIGWTTLLQMEARIRQNSELHTYVAGWHEMTLDSDKIESGSNLKWGATERWAERGGWQIGHRGSHEQEHLELSNIAERFSRCVTSSLDGLYYGWYHLRGAKIVRGSVPNRNTLAKSIKIELRDINRKISEETILRCSNAYVMNESEYATVGKREPKNQNERDSKRISKMGHLVGRNSVDNRDTAKLLLHEDRKGKLTQKIRNYVTAGLLHGGELHDATVGDGHACISGYRAHMDAYTASIYASVIILEDVLGPEFLRWYLGPPGVVPPKVLKNWKKLTIRDETLFYNAIKSKIGALHLTVEDLERCGARMVGNGFVKFIGTHLQNIGLKSKSRKPRINGKRVTEYSIDMSDAMQTQSLSKVQCARARGWEIPSLSPSFNDTEWMQTVRDGNWVHFQSIQDAISSETENIESDFLEVAEQTLDEQKLKVSGCKQVESDDVF
jgi:hypothetical protein